MLDRAKRLFSGEKKKNPETKKSWITRKRTYLLSLLAIIAVAELGKVGTEKIDLQAEYEQTLNDKQAEYDSKLKAGELIFNEDGGQRIESFETYLALHGIPKPTDMEALYRLMKEFKYPIEFYNGPTLLQRLAQLVVGEKYAMYKPNQILFEFKGHEIYMFDEKGKKEFLVTTEVVNKVLGELAHAYQSETGRPIFSIDDLTSMFQGTEFDEAYDNPRSPEYIAHEIFQPELRNRMEDLKKGAIVSDELLANNKLIGYDFEAEDPSYERFSEYLADIEKRVNEDNHMGHFLLEYMRDLPGFNATLVQRELGKVPYLKLVPSKTLYNSFITLIRFDRPHNIANIIEPRFSSPPEDKAVTDFHLEVLEQQYEQAKAQFKPLVDKYFMIGRRKEFTKDTYDRFIKFTNERPENDSHLSDRLLFNSLITTIHKHDSQAGADLYQAFKRIYDNS